MNEKKAAGVLGYLLLLHLSFQKIYLEFLKEKKDHLKFLLCLLLRTECHQLCYSPSAPPPSTIQATKM